MYIKNEFTKTFENITFKFDFVMIYIIHKMLVLLKNHLSYIKNNIFECFFKKFIRLFFYFIFSK